MSLESIEDVEGEWGFEDEDEDMQVDDGSYDQQHQESSCEGDEDLGETGGLYSAQVVNDQIFEDLELPVTVVQEVSLTWQAFLEAAESTAGAGDRIYAAVFDAAPGLQALFKTPRAVMGLRFVEGIGRLVVNLRNPKDLKIDVETLSFQHLDIEVTVPRVGVFRDGILEMLQEELGSRFFKTASDGWATLLNYAGGAFIHVRLKYADRCRVLATSWAQANSSSDRHADRQDVGLENADILSEGGHGSSAGGSHALDVEEGVAVNAPRAGKSKPIFRSLFGMKSKAGSSSKHGSSSCSNEGRGEGDVQGDMMNNMVPRTFQEMFLFNATVMGYTRSAWMQEILASFDTIVTNISNSYRLQEECDVLSLRIAKYKGVIDLGEFKAVMLSSLRSLVRDWGSLHETSWAWLWENVARMLQASLGKPAAQESSLSKVLSNIDPDTFALVRCDIYKLFFALAPSGQDHFKQSTTRLHFIADRVFAFSLDMYKEPKRMVDDLSALGLRHVGYGIPTELFAPFVTCCVKVMGDVVKNDAATEAFSWSLNLISRMLRRVISEGSTIVMQAINANSERQLKKAVACAARGKRASWVLKVQVGTQAISPLMWAIESGSFEVATAIISDLLTIRADRDSYYYGMDALFNRHPDIIKRLCLDAPVILPVLLDGLVWRARATKDGQRRVNYYVEHLLVDSDGKFSKAIEWIVDYGDPNIACHPVFAWVSDVVWCRVALRTFLFRRAWFLCNLIIFLLAQSVLHYIDCGQTTTDVKEVSPSSNDFIEGDSSAASIDEASPRCVHGFEVRLGVISMRSFIYTFSMGQMLLFHAKSIYLGISQRDFFFIFGCMKLPSYLRKWQSIVSLCLTLCLVAMLMVDPTYRCAKWSSELFDDHCPAGEAMFPYYKPISTVAALLYFWLLSDLVVLSTRVSAFVLVCCKLADEVLLTLIALTFFVVAFACAMSSLNHNDEDFSGIRVSSVSLFRISFGLYDTVHVDHAMEFPALVAVLVIFNLITAIFLMNMLIAQLNCAYQATYGDMVGFARLSRGKIVVETMPSVREERFQDFVSSLRLDQRLEFGEGDIGLAGGVQVFEPASLNITTVDAIQRFGGTTSCEAQWPAEGHREADAMDGFERLERHIDKAVKRLMGKGRKGGGGSPSMSGSSVRCTEDSSLLASFIEQD